MKTCSKCKSEKPVAEFTKKSDSRDGRHTYCKLCVKETNKTQYEKNKEGRKAYQRAYREQNLAACQKRAADWAAKNPEEAARSRLKWQRTSGWITTLLCRSRAIAKRSGYEFDLDAEWIEGLFARQAGLCFWYQIPMSAEDKARNPAQPSIDRIDCSKGYLKSNVVLTCAAANMGRSDCDPETFSKFASHLVSSRNEDVGTCRT